jgi:hypothetical protein
MTSKSELRRRATLNPAWAPERIYELEEQIKIAVEALEYYACAETYLWVEVNPLARVRAILEPEAGEKARTALAKIRGEK